MERKTNSMLELLLVQLATQFTSEHRSNASTTKCCILWVL